MIAISANTHKVTVIAYALTQLGEYSDTSSASSDVDMEDCSDNEDPSDFPSPRRQDHVIVLSARHNVPSVSFNNGGDDTTGRWLSSCSINGETSIWDLHHPEKCVRVIRLGFCASVKDPTKAPQHNPGTCGCLRPSNFPHAIWSNMFLNASTAYEDASLRDLALPLHHDHPLPYIQDISACKAPFSVKSRQKFPRTSSPTHDVLSEEEMSEMDISEDDSDSADYEPQTSSSSESSNVEQLQQSGDEDDAIEQTFDQPPSSLLSVTAANTEAALADEEGMSHSPTAHQPPIQTQSNAINAFGVWFQPPNSTATIIWDDDDSGSDDELFVPSTVHAQMVFANAFQLARAYCEVTTAFTLARQVRQLEFMLLIPN